MLYDEDKLTGVQTFFALVKGFVSAVMLYLPKVFQDGGLVFTTILMTVSGFSYMYCSHLLIDARVKLNLATYSELGEAVLGPFGKVLIDICLACSLMSFVCGFIYILVQDLTEIFNVDRWVIFLLVFLV